MKNTNSELWEKLKKTEGLSSLNIERKIWDSLVKNNWDSIRSPYYQDKQSNKFRELDMIARQFYQGLANNDTALFMEIVLAIECKSISGYHIIVDGEVKVKNLYAERLEQSWVGHDLNYSEGKIKPILDKSSLTEDMKSLVLKSIEAAMYPGDFSVLQGFIPNPFKLNKFSAFRETNIGATKELDTSVIWKSFMTLNSAGESYGTFHWERIESELLSHCRFSNTLNLDVRNLRSSLFFQSLNRHISMHKILVIDAAIWKNGQSMKRIPYFRFLQRNLYGHLDQWVDVVNLQSFDKYIELLSRHYNKFFQKTNLERVI